MRLLGGARIVALAVVASTVLSACVSAPVSERPALRVLPGGVGVGTTPSPAPSISARPEPPIGVIMSGRVVIGCDMGTQCTYFARLVPLRTESPDPTAPPDPVGVAATVTLVGANAEPRGFGPTARLGRPADHEPAGSTLLTPGLWHIDAWTTTLELQPVESELPTPTRLSCELDFELQAGHTLSLNLAHGSTGCSIRLAGALIP